MINENILFGSGRSRSRKNGNKSELNSGLDMGLSSVQWNDIERNI